MATRVSTGSCATPGCPRQRVAHGVWCEVHEGDIPAFRQAEAQKRQRRLAKRLGVNEATLRAALAGLEPPPGLPVQCCCRCGRRVYGGADTCDDCLMREAAWKRVEAVYARRNSRAGKILLCIALLGICWALMEAMR